MPRQPECRRSVALMMLYEQGHFQLNDPVSRFIPQWRDLAVYQAGTVPAFMTRPVDRAMTIKDLFTHMSGLTYGFMNRTNVDHAYRKLDVGAGEGRTLRTMIDTLAKLPLEFSPGTRWNYSVATDVLGYLVEVISGMSFDAYLQKRIFEPLGMHDTGFQVPARSVERFAANYSRGAGKSLKLDDDPQKSVYLTPRTFFSGGGGLVSTAHDYLRFCRMLVNGGELDGARILGRKTIELMTRNHLPNDQDLTQWALGSFSETSNEGYGFGLGFSINLGPARTATIRLGRRIRVGRRREHDLLGRSRRRARRDPDDAIHAVGDVQLSRPTENVGVSGDRRLVRDDRRCGAARTWASARRRDAIVTMGHYTLSS